MLDFTHRIDNEIQRLHKIYPNYILAITIISFTIKLLNYQITNESTKLRVFVSQTTKCKNYSYCFIPRRENSLAWSYLVVK